MKPYETGAKTVFQNDFSDRFRAALGREPAELWRKTVALYQS